MAVRGEAVGDAASVPVAIGGAPAGIACAGGAVAAVAAGRDNTAVAAGGTTGWVARSGFGFGRPAAPFGGGYGFPQLAPVIVIVIAGFFARLLRERFDSLDTDMLHPHRGEGR